MRNAPVCPAAEPFRTHIAPEKHAAAPPVFLRVPREGRGRWEGTGTKKTRGAMVPKPHSYKLYLKHFGTRKDNGAFTLKLSFGLYAYTHTSEPEATATRMGSL